MGIIMNFDAFAFFSFIILGYKCFKGQVLSDSDLSDLYEGLKVNDINHYTHLLTGNQKSHSILQTAFCI
jgi:pyridoxal/pyridoxine/pyridoxamine kinase